MTGRRGRVEIFTDAQAVASAAREEFVRSAREAIAARGRFTVALAGGSTPKTLYGLLAEQGGALLGDRSVWERVHVFWGDERHVPPDHADSNYRMANEAMLSKVPIPPGNVHRIASEIADAGRAAEAYERTLQGVLHLPAGDRPRFDLVLLGMGPDGHTASLFPGTTALTETTRLVTSPWVDKLDTYRITLTAPVLNAAARVLFLVGGADKAETLREVREGDYEPLRLPSQLIRPDAGELVWFVDEAAARLLTH